MGGKRKRGRGRGEKRNRIKNNLDLQNQHKRKQTRTIIIHTIRHTHTPVGTKNTVTGTYGKVFALQKNEKKQKIETNWDKSSRCRV